MSGTLIVAIVALVVSTSTLTWQVVQFLLAASRVEVELRWGAHNGTSVITSLVRRGGGVDFASLQAQGYAQPVLAVLARNKGRLAVSVTGWSIAFDNGGAFSVPGMAVNEHASLPHRLEPGSEATWMCPYDETARALTGFDATSRPVRSLRARVSLGTGKTATSKNRLER